MSASVILCGALPPSSRSSTHLARPHLRARPSSSHHHHRYNKYILSEWGFPFPITVSVLCTAPFFYRRPSSIRSHPSSRHCLQLTMWHMFFCSVASFVLVQTKTVADVAMSQDLFLSSVLPIGAQRGLLPGCR